MLHSDLFIARACAIIMTSVVIAATITVVVCTVQVNVVRLHLKIATVLSFICMHPSNIA